MIKKAFTLIELIFVVVIIGVLAGVGSSSFRSNYLQQDINFITQQIKRAHYKGIGFEHTNFGGGTLPADFENGCIDINNISLSTIFSEEAPYNFHVDPFDVGVICFDTKGRPHNNDFSLATLRSTDLVIPLTYNAQTKNIRISAITGFADCE